MRPNTDAIFERYEDATRGWMEYPTVLSAQDVPALLAYIDELENMPLVQTVVKLQEENERLKANNLIDHINELWKINVNLRKDNEKAYQMNSDMALTLIEKSDEIERLNEIIKDRTNDVIHYDSENKKLQEENERAHIVVEHLLLSADCTWEERGEGHDWGLACHDARRFLEGANK